MGEAIIVAIIGGAAAVIGQIIISKRQNKDLYAELKQQSKDFYAELDKRQAVTDVKIEDLTREVRVHNNFAQRVPALEEKYNMADFRITNLEKRAS